ncbi:MAG TPA: hypothetical protein VGQ91_03995 [Ideonella sp.]|nr:hypothetical protein [Ideonella sp.]
MNLKNLVLCAVCVLACGSVVHAHGSDASPAAASVGQVSFANSGAQAAQRDFLLGLAQLHNFEYRDAAAAFQRAQKADPSFAMAYWGEAMTYNHPLWAQQDLVAARAALLRLATTPEARQAKAKTEREKAYLAALEDLYGEGSKAERDLRYAAAMRALHERFPADIDATCFYALALMGTSHEGRHLPSYINAAALMIEIFHAHPQHPGAAHYLIHAVDDPLHAPLGLSAARAYSKIAPAAAHAQHMTSHIFIAMGMWEDVVRANETAMRIVDKARAELSRPPAGCGHTLTWLEYGYLQQGRLADARRVLARCAEEARQRPFVSEGADLLDIDGSSAASFASQRARYLIDSGDWNGEVASWTVDVAKVPVAEFMRDHVDALAALRQRDRAVPAGLVERAERSAAKVITAIDEAGLPPKHPARKVLQLHVDQLHGLQQLRDGKTEAALATLRQAAADETALPYEFGPPTILKPGNELLGEVLLELGRPADARQAFDAALQLAPGRLQSLEGRKRSQASSSNQPAS